MCLLRRHDGRCGFPVHRGSDGHHANPPLPVRSGFCFAEFSDHESAHAALRVLTSIGSNGGGGSGAYSQAHTLRETAFAQGYGSPEVPQDAARARAFAAAAQRVGEICAVAGVRVDWAEPLHEVPIDVMRVVRVLYVSNLPQRLEDASEVAIARVFDAAAGGRGAVERVKRMKNFAFVHFRTRAAAEAALAATTGPGSAPLMFGGNVVKVQWSKPPPSAMAAVLAVDAWRKITGEAPSGAAAGAMPGSSPSLRHQPLQLAAAGPSMPAGIYYGGQGQPQRHDSGRPFSREQLPHRGGQPASTMFYTMQQQLMAQQQQQQRFAAHQYYGQGVEPPSWAEGSAFVGGDDGYARYAEQAEQQPSYPEGDDAYAPPAYPGGGEASFAPVHNVPLPPLPLELLPPSVWQLPQQQQQRIATNTRDIEEAASGSSSDAARGAPSSGANAEVRSSDSSASATSMHQEQQRTFGSPSAVVDPLHSSSTPRGHSRTGSIANSIASGPGTSVFTPTAVDNGAATAVSRFVRAGSLGAATIESVTSGTTAAWHSLPPRDSLPGVRPYSFSDSIPVMMAALAHRRAAASDAMAARGAMVGSAQHHARMLMRQQQHEQQQQQLMQRLNSEDAAGARSLPVEQPQGHTYTLWLPSGHSPVRNLNAAPARALPSAPVPVSDAHHGTAIPADRVYMQGQEADVERAHQLADGVSHLALHSSAAANADSIGDDDAALGAILGGRAFRSATVIGPGGGSRRFRHAVHTANESAAAAAAFDEFRSLGGPGGRLQPPGGVGGGDEGPLSPR